MLCRLVLGILGLGCWISMLQADPVIEKADRLEINWAKHRVQFYGIAQAKKLLMGEDLKAVERRAWKEGLGYINKKSREIYFSTFEPLDLGAKQLNEGAESMSRLLSQATMSLNTVYGADGTVQVILENALTKVCDPKGLKFGQKEASIAGATQYSGIVLQLDRRTNPRAIYQIMAEDGQILFDYRSIAEDAFKRNLMGRWFRSPTASELLDTVGPQSVTIKGRVVKDGLFQVVREEWEAATLGHRGLLVAASIALVLP